MLKKFMSGLGFGAGFALAFFMIAAAAIYFVFPIMTTRELTAMPEPEEVHSPPKITHPDRYLGISGAYSGNFPHGENRVLSSGPGQIVGVATVNGKPLEGLRLRLALNGSVSSQWATTGPDGQYAIGVPYGEYRVDGYSLDTKTANSVLAGKIDHPSNPHSGGTFDITKDAAGEGLNLRFVDPVVLAMPKRAFSVDDDIVIRWKLYPGAKEYVVQLFVTNDPTVIGTNDTVFPWPERPVVNDPIINLGDYDVDLKAGHYYTVDVEARADNRQAISRIARRHAEFDFKVVE